MKPCHRKLQKASHQGINFIENPNVISSGNPPRKFVYVDEMLKPQLSFILETLHFCGLHQGFQGLDSLFRATLANQGKKSNRQCSAFQTRPSSRLERPVAPNSSPQLYLWLSGELFHSLFSLFSVGYAAELPERDGEEERKNCHFYACDHSHQYYSIFIC